MAGRPQPADLVAGFSLPLPAQVICEMLGVPAEDTGQFHAWSDTIIGDWQADPGQIMTALAGLYGYFGALIQTKRARPAGDLMSALIAARDQDDRLSEQELTTLFGFVVRPGNWPLPWPSCIIFRWSLPAILSCPPAP